MNFNLINKLMNLREICTSIYLSFNVKYDYNELDKFIALNYLTTKVDNFLYRL